jgi:hypothetical protein
MLLPVLTGVVVVKVVDREGNLMLLSGIGWVVRVVDREKNTAPARRQLVQVIMQPHKRAERKRSVQFDRCLQCGDMMREPGKRKVPQRLAIGGVTSSNT